MKRVRFGSIIVALVSFSVLLTSGESVHGQEDPQPSREPAVFKAQLLQFLQLGRRTVREIQALPVDDSIPVDPRVHHNAREAYVLIRAARWGMELAIQRQTYQDPILGLAHKRVDVAWNLARFPVDNTGLPRAEYINRSVQDVSRAIRLVNQALAMLP
jgi:hypothetical protein